MTNPTPAEMERAIAERLGWKTHPGAAVGWPPDKLDSNWPNQIPRYTTDANAALEAAAKLIGAFNLTHMISGQWCSRTTTGAYFAEAHTPSLAICKMLWVRMEQK